MEYKKINLMQYKAQKDGTFSGYASVFGCVDYDGDIILKGAFTQSLKEWGQQRQWPLLLWQHDVKEPIGYCTHLKEDGHGLAITGKFMLALRRGREAHNLVKECYLKGLSIGFIPQKTHHLIHKGVRVIERVDLKEVSVVTFPANPKAGITWVSA